MKKSAKICNKLGQSNVNSAKYVKTIIKWLFYLFWYTFKAVCTVEMMINMGYNVVVSLKYELEE
jgi:hypothetical protein